MEDGHNSEDKDLLQNSHWCEGFRRGIEFHTTGDHAVTVYQCDVCGETTWTYHHLPDSKTKHITLRANRGKDYIVQHNRATIIPGENYFKLFPEKTPPSE